jgi:formylglycine-generating enzyme required for sulfatase activity
LGGDSVESRVSITNYINAVRNYLKKDEIEDRLIPNSENSEINDTFTSPSTGIEFVMIPAGEFDIGLISKEEKEDEEKNKSKDKSPYKCLTRKVTIKNSFYMGKSSVTQKQWKKIMRKNPSYFKGEDRPVEMVSWIEVQKFVKKLNEKEQTDKYRLPSEAEWEYACKAGTQTKYYFGDDDSKLSEYAWYAENSGNQTHPVAQKKHNLWDLYDMNGNVWEWVQDNWHENFNGAPVDGSAWEDEGDSHRVSCGGSWYCSAILCRSASRFRRDPENHISNLGFRLLREL